MISVLSRTLWDQRRFQYMDQRLVECYLDYLSSSYNSRILIYEFLRDRSVCLRDYQSMEQCYSFELAQRSVKSRSLNLSQSWAFLSLRYLIQFQRRTRQSPRYFSSQMCLLFSCCRSSTLCCRITTFCSQSLQSSPILVNGYISSSCRERACPVPCEPDLLRTLLTLVQSDFKILEAGLCEFIQIFRSNLRLFIVKVIEHLQSHLLKSHEHHYVPTYQSACIR